MDNELESLLIDVCQLIDSHGTVPHELTDWDKQVRQRISDYRASRVSRTLSAVPSELPALISDLIEYFEPLADADASGDPLEYRGNMEMSLLTRLQEIERGIAG